MSAPDAPTWYDLLGVEPDADSDAVRAAFRSATADLDPGTRRFELLSRAAAVLLSPSDRAAYDAELAGPAARDAAAPDGDPAPDAAGVPVVTGPTAAEDADDGSAPGESPEPAADTAADSGTDAGTDSPPDSTSGSALDATSAAARRVVPAWLLALVGVLALAAVVWAVLAFRGSSSADEAADAARQAAEQAVVPVLAYGAETLEADQQAAHEHLTRRYRGTYDQMFELIRENAPNTGTTVEVTVVESAVVRASEDRVQVLLFVDRPTTNKTTPEPVTYRDQVTLTMQRQGDTWLVDDLRTSPVS